MTEYESIEEKVTKPVMKFSSYFIPIAYGILATPFRIPTFLRKLECEQTLANKISQKDEENNIYTIRLGMASGMLGLLGIASYLTKEAINGNYTPAITTGITLTATNVISGVYELGKSLKRHRSEVEKDIK